MIRTLVLGLVCLLSGPLLAQVPAELDAATQGFIATHFEAAKQAEEAQNLSKATQEYQVILDKYPEAIPEIYQNLGLIYYLQRRYEDAISTFNTGLQLKSNMVGSRLFLGVCYLAVAQPRKALPHLMFAHRRKPTVESANYLSIAYSETARLEQALPLLRLCLDRSDQKDVYLYRLGDAYLRLANRDATILTDETPDMKYGHLLVGAVFESQEYFQLAAQEYLLAAGLDPANANALFSLARVLLVLGQETPSKLALDRHHELMPSHRDVQLDPQSLPQRNLAEIGEKIDFEAELRVLPPVEDSDRLLPLVSSDVRDLIREKMSGERRDDWEKATSCLLVGDWQSARNVLRKIPSNSNEWLRNFLMARAHVWGDDFVSAEAVFNRSLRGFVAFPAVRLLRWEILHRRSLGYFDRLLKELPESGRAHYVRARTLEEQGKKEALAEYEAAVKADPEQPDYHVALADLHLSNANYQEALTACLRELEINPYSTAAKVRLGRIYVQLREPDKGMPYLEEVLRVDPNDGQARSDLAKGWELRRDYKRALQEYKRALEDDPSLTRLHYVLGRLYRRLKNPEAAQREFDLFQQKEAEERRRHRERVERFRKGPTSK